MDTLRPRLRYAPSPTGDPHIGNIRTALFGYLYKIHTGGTFILRIEDTDRTREVEGGVDRIKESLLWLGMQWDEGPVFQSDRLDRYKEIALDLIRNDHAYYCFCSAERLAEVRKAQEAAHQPTMYDKFCRNINASEAQNRAETEAHVIRLKVPETGETLCPDLLRGDIVFQNHTIDDQVLIKSDGYPTYHLAVVVDDHDMAITHVTRGDDWISSMPKHVLLYQFLGWELPVFIHPPLIIGADRKKLSKRLGDTSVLSYRDQGYDATAMVNFLARLGFTPQDERKLYTIDELASEFTFEKLHTNPAIFDLTKLQWFNRLAKEQGRAEEGDLLNTIADVLKEHKLVSDPPTESQYYFIKEVAKRVDTKADIEPMLTYLWQAPQGQAIDLTALKLTQHQAIDILTAIEKATTETESWDDTTIGNFMRTIQHSIADVPSKFFYQLATFVIAGTTTAPPLFASISLLGKAEFLKRIASAKAVISS